MNEECQCVCHKTTGVMHCFPCCVTCPNCGKHILYDHWQQHKKKCVVELPEEEQ